MDWDTNLFYSVNHLAGQAVWLDQFMRLVARPWTFLIPGLVAAGLWFHREGRPAVWRAAALAAIVLTVDFSGTGVKQLVARPRPCQVLSEVTRVTGCGRAYGFPSNHAVNTAAAGVFFQLIYPKSGFVVWPLVLLIGINRVYVGAHYPTDVLGGWLLGALGAWFAVFLLRRRGLLAPK